MLRLSTAPPFPITHPTVSLSQQTWSLHLKLLWISLPHSLAILLFSSSAIACLCVYIYLNLIFVGPCIIIYSYSTTNKMHLLPQIIYSCKMLCMFQTVFLSIIRSSKLCIQERYMSNSCCCLLPSPIAVGSSSCLTYSIAVYTVLSSLWWVVRPSETCRAFYKNKSFEMTGASYWLYYRNIYLTNIK
jgi:hypothetical protein